MQERHLGFDLQSYFVHPTLLLTAVDAEAKSRIERALKTASGMSKPYSTMSLQPVFSDEAKHFVVTHRVPALEELLITRQIQHKRYVTVERAFYFKGAPKAMLAKQRNLRPEYVEFKARLREYPDLVICGKFDPEKITTDTGYDTLSRQRRLFMLAYITSASKRQVKLRPIMIADRVAATKCQSVKSVLRNAMHIFVDQIDEFDKARQINVRDIDIEELRNYPESQIKKWLAEIIGEKYVTKDWGGEQSDLYTSHLHIDGQRVRAAFLLKGPSHFSVMKNIDLGKNGDQIVRLFQEPADIYILQHCHYISTGVWHTMEAFSSRFFQQSMYSVMDGTDTLRILKAYKKI